MELGVEWYKCLLKETGVFNVYSADVNITICRGCRGQFIWVEIRKFVHSETSLHYEVELRMIRGQMIREAGCFLD